MRNADKETLNVIRSYGNHNGVPFKTMFKVLINGGTKWVVAHRVAYQYKLHPKDVCMETCDGLIFTTSVFNLRSNTKEWPAQEQKQRKTYKRPSKMKWVDWDEKYLKEGALVKCRNGIVHKLSKEETYSKAAQLLLLWFSSFNHKTGANKWTECYDIVSVLVDPRQGDPREERQKQEQEVYERVKEMAASVVVTILKPRVSHPSDPYLVWSFPKQHAESNCKFVSLSLTQDEAQVIRDIIGHCVLGDSEKSRRKFADSVFDKLKSHTKRNSLSETGISPDGYSISFEDET